jgi:hypothetical protein
MILLSDNDVILKLVLCDLVDEAFAALECGAGEVMVLPSAKFTLGVAKNADKTRRRIGDEAFGRLEAFFGAVQELTDQVDSKEQLIFDDLLGIDPGEAILFSATRSFKSFLLATGDKRSLVVLGSNEQCKPICEHLHQRVICFEQIILRIVGSTDFGVVLKKVVPARSCDTALRAVFGSGLTATEESVREGLTSYIEALRKNTGGLLCTE